MQFELSARGIEITDDLRRHVAKKLGKIEKHFDKNEPAQVVLTSEKGRHSAEITLPFRGMFVRGEEATEDVYASVTLAVDKIARRMAKYRERLQSRKRARRARARSLPPETGEASEPRLVKVKRFNIKPMNVEEAIVQMNLLGHDFFVFTSADTDEVNVLYRRKDGNYGLIEPE